MRYNQKGQRRCPVTRSTDQLEQGKAESKDCCRSAVKAESLILTVKKSEKRRCRQIQSKKKKHTDEKKQKKYPGPSSHQTRDPLDSFTIARLLRANGFTVQEVYFIERENKSQCVIVTNCEKNAETMEAIRLRLKAENYVLYVRPLVTQGDCEELMSDEQTRISNSEFVLVIEEHPKSTAPAEETTWCTNTMFLVEKNETGWTSPKFYAITTFHTFKDDRIVKKPCGFKFCECCELSARRTTAFLRYWTEFKEERRCRSPKKRAHFIEHLNRLIEKKEIYLSLVRTDDGNGERIAVEYIVSADYQVTSPRPKRKKSAKPKHLLDCVLLKLDDEDVTKLNDPKFSFLRTVRTAYNETRFLTDMNQDKLIEPLVCCGRYMFPSISDECRQYRNTHLDYRRAISTTSRLRVLGAGQSGSLLLHLTKKEEEEEDEDKKDADAVAVGYLCTRRFMRFPVTFSENEKENEKKNEKENEKKNEEENEKKNEEENEEKNKIVDHWEPCYAFARIDEQLKALQEFNRNYPFNRAVINELVLPMLES